MCGIAGVLSDSLIRSEAMLSVLNLLHHRGPDAAGQWANDCLWMGHTRLAILDLSPAGQQPMSYQNNRYCITFNGEIYNYLELRAELLDAGHRFVSYSDTEVLLAAYAHWGTDCLAKLRGMFAFAIWDQVEKTLFLARDRAGEKPIYYWADAHTFYFASELKALLALLPNTPELDPVAIDLFLHYQYVPEPRTPLQGILKLPAAHYLLLHADDLQVQPKRYWNLAQIQPIMGNPAQLIRDELEQVVELTLRSDVPVGVALSGGLDSGAIAALAAPKYKDVLQAFSVGYPGRPACDERDQAEALAKQLGLPFNEVELHPEALVEFFPDLVRSMDDPIADIAAYGHYSVMELAADQGIKVMLSGIGGDELFWGYDWVVAATHLTQQKQSTASASSHSIWESADSLTYLPLYRRLMNSPKVPAMLRSLLRQMLENNQIARHHPNQGVFYNIRAEFRDAWHHHSTLYTEEFLAKLPPRNPFQPFTLAHEHWDDVPNQVTQLVFDTWLVSNCLALGDRTSMASSLEVRLPLLDHKLIELVVGLRKNKSDLGLGHKFWLKQAVRDVLPAEVIDRPKRGFEPPYVDWIRSLLDRYGDWVLDGYLVNLGFFVRPCIQKLFNQYRQNLAMVYKLIVLEVWYRSIVVQESEQINFTQELSNV
ncbi:asparagine synthase (glutamine-hydrolyzing) [Cyanobacteria bacterium FACHB-DQ100]|nr:asparagine synthase (glutamine-hydrolyzing) [Cyanobacteria bacterium FACHB-DQ100]